jgi:hypothetical protein
MQDPANELRRIVLPRNPVNKGERKGRTLEISPDLNATCAATLFAAYARSLERLAMSLV